MTTTPGPRAGRTRRCAEAVTFSYGSLGEVFVTDASGATSSLFFNELGQVLETRDPARTLGPARLRFEHRPDGSRCRSIPFHSSP
jgi:hypothetical protein